MDRGGRRQLPFDKGFQEFFKLFVMLGLESSCKGQWRSALFERPSVMAVTDGPEASAAHSGNHRWPANSAGWPLRWPRGTNPSPGVSGISQPTSSAIVRRVTASPLTSS